MKSSLLSNFLQLRTVRLNYMQFYKHTERSSFNYHLDCNFNYSLK